MHHFIAQHTLREIACFGRWVFVYYGKTWQAKILLALRD